MNRISTHITYLDTTGRPAITLKYKQLTDRHDGMIYVCFSHTSDDVPLSDATNAGCIQGAIYGSSEEAARCRCGADGSFRCGLCVETHRHPDSALSRDRNVLVVSQNIYTADIHWTEDEGYDTRWKIRASDGKLRDVQDE